MLGSMKWLGRGTWLSAVIVVTGACGDSGESEAADPSGLAACEGGLANGESCIDEFGARLCPVNTGWPGDDLALCDSGKDLGLLYHYGPSDYDDPDEIDKFKLEAGGEDENCVFVQSQNTEPMFASEYHGRMRPGSHHLIVTVVADAPADLVLDEVVPCNQGEAVGLRWLIGSQDPQIDLSANGSTRMAKPSPEDPDYGAATVIPANAILRIDMHYLNPTDEEILREAWVWMERIEEDDVDVQVDMITWYQGLIDVPPMSKGVETQIGRCRVPSDRYLGLVTGHFHENGTRMTVWHEPKGEDPRKIYETFNWEDPGNAVFADRIENPAMDNLQVGEWGSHSGYVPVKEGDYVNFQCEFDNPTDTTVALGDTGSDQMCNIFGFYYPTDGDVWNCVCAGGICL